NTIREPSGETEADQPSSLICLALPPRIDTAHRLFLEGAIAHDTNNCELSGNHPKKVMSETFASRGRTSPVEPRRKYAPVLSEYARYLPSGDIAEAMIQFSLAFVVKRRNVSGACDDLDPTARRQRNHPPPIPATTTMANSAPTNCHFRVHGPEALVGCTLVAVRPGSVSCSKR